MEDVISTIKEPWIKRNWILVAIIAGIIVTIVLACFVVKVSVKTSAINKEEQIYESASAINVQFDARNRKISQIADVAERYAEQERVTLSEVTEARRLLNEGETGEAATILNAVVEKYPDIKSDVNYTKLTNEIITCENKIADYRQVYNDQVKSYRKYCRNPINSWILGSNYVMIDESTYLEFDEDIEEIGELFTNEKV